MNESVAEGYAWFKPTEFETAALGDGVLLIDHVYNTAHLLSPDLSYLWRSLEAGISVTAIVSEMAEAFSCSIEEAERRYLDVLEHLQHFFGKREMRGERLQQTVPEIYLGAGEKRVRLGLRGCGINCIFSDANDAARVSQRFSPYFAETGEGISDCYFVRLGSRLLVAHKPTNTLEMIASQRLLISVHQVIQRNYIRLGAYSIALHAAAVEFAGRVIVLTGRSGVGKTTLATALCARGGRLLSEDMLFASKDGLHFLATSPLVRIRNFVRAYVTSLYPALAMAEELEGKDGVSFSFLPVPVASSTAAAAKVELLVLEAPAKPEAPLQTSTITNPRTTLGLLIGSGCVISSDAAVENISKSLKILTNCPTIAVASWTFDSLCDLITENAQATG